MFQAEFLAKKLEFSGGKRSFSRKPRFTSGSKSNKIFGPLDRDQLLISIERAKYFVFILRDVLGTNALKL